MKERLFNVRAFLGLLASRGGYEGDAFERNCVFGTIGITGWL